MENKHYIRIADDTTIIIGFSDAFQNPQDGDICILENADRHFAINGKINPILTDEKGCPLYYYDNEKILETSEAFRNNWIESHRDFEKEYQTKVIQLIRETYTQEDETGLTNDCLLAVMAGETIPETYITYRNFVEYCKDTAYLEVYGSERA